MGPEGERATLAKNFIVTTPPNTRHFKIESVGLLLSLNQCHCGRGSGRTTVPCGHVVSLLEIFFKNTEFGAENHLLKETFEWGKIEIFSTCTHLLCLKFAAVCCKITKLSVPTF